ncbi:MAG: class I SAM-dependent methyltransferase [Candidatus Spyradenecus sp.]
MSDWEGKSSIEAIRARFEGDVERFCRLESGQSSTMDAPVAMALITEAAVRSTQPIRRVLDVGCGAGNNTIALLRRLGAGMSVDCDLLDLAGAMLARAQVRVAGETRGEVRLIQADFREASLAEGAYDVILAAAVLHHLRDDDDWERAFAKLYRLLRPGGSVWITDLVAHEIPGVQAMMSARYGDYLERLGGAAYREAVFANIAAEDSPRPVTYQLDLLRRVGFSRVELLHKNTTFAAFGAVR